MGILDTDIGYQLGLLAGGLWAERYRERGAEEKAQAAQQTIYNQTMQNWNDLGDHLGVTRTTPPIGSVFTNPYATQPNYMDQLRQRRL